MAEEQLAAVVQNEEKLKLEVAELRTTYRAERLLKGPELAPSRGDATGPTGPMIDKIALTAEALSGSLCALRLGIAGDANQMSMIEHMLRRSADEG